MKVVKASELQLADIVLPLDGKGGVLYDNGPTAVKQIKDGQITLFRPYPHTADFSCTSGVICYVGTEIYKIPIDDSEWALLRRKKLK